MHLEDSEAFLSQARYRSRLLSSQTLVLTYDGPTDHPFFGTCRTRIYRAIGNDSGMKIRMTIELLKKYEPKVGMWTGDVIQYIDDTGFVLEEKQG
jgi:hypothetical protein